MFDLTGRTALVTGGGRGAGAAIAAALASRGAAVGVNDVVAERADTTAAAIRDAGGRAVAAPFDITDRDAVEEGVSASGSALGSSFDILVNNAGPPAGMTTTPFRDMDPADWQQFVDINLYGSLHCIRAVLDPMVDAGWLHPPPLPSRPAPSPQTTGRKKDVPPRRRRPRSHPRRFAS